MQCATSTPHGFALHSLPEQGAHFEIASGINLAYDHSCTLQPCPQVLHAFFDFVAGEVPFLELFVGFRSEALVEPHSLPDKLRILLNDFEQYVFGQVKLPNVFIVLKQLALKHQRKFILQDFLDRALNLVKILFG